VLEEAIVISYGESSDWKSQDAGCVCWMILDDGETDGGHFCWVFVGSLPLPQSTKAPIQNTFA